MNHLFILILLFSNQHPILMLLPFSIISNQSFHIEEYGTVKFDCLVEHRILAAWRVSLRHDNIHR